MGMDIDYTIARLERVWIEELGLSKHGMNSTREAVEDTVDNLVDLYGVDKTGEYESIYRSFLKQPIEFRERGVDPRVGMLHNQMVEGGQKARSNVIACLYDTNDWMWLTEAIMARKYDHVDEVVE